MRWEDVRDKAWLLAVRSGWGRLLHTRAEA